MTTNVELYTHTHTYNIHVDKSNVYIYITVTAVMCVHSTDHHMQVPVAAQCHVFSERRMTLSD